MDQKQLLDAAALAVDAARKAGADQSEALLQQTNLFQVRLREGKPDLLKQATQRGLGLRVFVRGKPGFASSSDLRPESLAFLAQKAVALAGVGEADPLAGLPEGAGGTAGANFPDDATLDLYDPDLVALSTDQKIEMARATEAAARDADKRITQVEGTSFRNNTSLVTLVNSLGFSRQFRVTSASLSTRALVDDRDGKKQNGNYGTGGRFLKDLDPPEKVGGEAARLAIEKIGPVQLTTRKAPVLMHRDVAAAWLQNLAGAFYGDQVFKKASWLADRLGQPVGAPLVTLVDDGLLKRGFATTPFDGEGVPSQRNVLLDKGVVTTFLYDTYNARRAKTKSTGNAVRGYDAVPAIGTHNLYIENGTSTLADLVRAFDAVFYMKDQGAFGYTPTTGDYSYQAAGLWIEKGKVLHPVDGVTVASNSLDMLKGIVKVGNDLEFNGPVNSPHLLIEEMTISGT